MESNLHREELLKKANTLPLCPGVYLMKDRSGKVIYVGKSRKLKNRVSQYFQNGEKNVKTSRMVLSVADFDYFLCDNEMEALSLENTLIKQYTPKYNIRLKDAKSYPYIKITDELYPRILFSRQRLQDGAGYFGPYSGVSTVFSLIELLNRTLGLPNCKRKFPRDIGKERPCIYYQMKRCSGVCTGHVTPEEHAKAIRYATEILNGKSTAVERELEKQMAAFSESERYEAAAVCRDQISAIRAIAQKQKVVAEPGTEKDVVSFYSDDFCTCISVFYIRNGVLQDKSDFLFGADRVFEQEDMTGFLSELYKTREYIPETVLLSFKPEAEELALLTESLSTVAGRKIRIHTPERGTLRTLCDMVDKNAADQAKLYQIDAENNDDILLRLSQLLKLETYPERIESYDISNYGKEHLTAGMVVVKNGKFSKSDYRTFRIQSVTDTADDYASMREALTRRFAHIKDEKGSFSELPDLILLDGGKNHVSVIRSLLKELDITVPVFGMVKDDYHKTRALCTSDEDISIAKEQALFGFIYKLQEEVHRFTISTMQAAKRKTLKTSSLTKIPGIGEQKAKKLLFLFGGIGKIKAADEEMLVVTGKLSRKDAAAVFAYFHKENKTE